MDSDLESTHQMSFHLFLEKHYEQSQSNNYGYLEYNELDSM